MNARDLEYLIALSEELHFGRAAERCHVSQPALSGQLRKLETRLGVPLFERTKRHVRLTEVGRQVVDRAREAIHQIQLMEGIAAANKDPFVGDCTIGMPPTIGPYLTPLLLPAISHYLPNLRLVLVEDFTDHLEVQLTNGELDFAVLATTPVHSTLSEIGLYEEPFWVALPSNHALSGNEVVDATQIKAEELLLLADGHCLRDQICDICNISKRQSHSPRGPKTQRTSLSTILSLVGAGNGVTLVPAMSLTGGRMTDSGIAVRREQSGAASRTIRLTYRTGYHRGPLIEKLADIIAGIVPDTVIPMRR